MKRTLVIREVGKKINFKNRIVRTPVNLDVTDNELKLLEVQLRLQGIVDYTLQEKAEKVEKRVIDEPPTEDEEIQEPHEKKDPQTILERLASEK